MRVGIIIITITIALLVGGCGCACISGSDPGVSDSSASDGGDASATPSETSSEKTSCAKSDINISNSSAHLTLVAEKWAKWKSASLESYLFTYRYEGNPCSGIAPLLTVTVAEGCVTSVYSETSGVNIDPGQGATIDDFFQAIVDKLENSPAVFGRNWNMQDQPPIFDEQYGFPVQYFISQTTAECDGGGATITGFQ